MTMHGFVLIFQTFHDPVLQCVTLCYSGWPFISLYDYVWLWKTQLDIVWLSMTLYVSVSPFMTLLESVSLILTVFWFFSYCFIPFNCLKCLTRSESVQLMQLWTNFGLVSWTCLGGFRMVQNGSNGLKRLKKSSMFSNCA